MPIEHTEADAQNLATLPSRPLLIVSNDPHDIQAFKRHLGLTYRLHFAHTQAQALAYLERYKPPIALLDLALGQTEGKPQEAFVTLTEMLRLAPTVKIIAVTDLSRRSDAVRAVGDGAYDFYHKPIEGAVLSIITNRAYRWDELEQENRSLALLSQSIGGHAITGASAVIQQLNKALQDLAGSRATVLINGESGVGKELAARALHAGSPRAEQRLVAVSCAALPPDLLEGELFGNAQDTADSSDKARKTRLWQAQGGTLFLDDIADLPLELQEKLVRFLASQSQGDSNVRVVCATNRNLRELAEKELFRTDLLQTLESVCVTVPPLRERGEDCVLLARSLLHRFNADYHQSRQGFTAEALTAMQQYHWPHNVRELEARVKRAVLMGEAPLLTAHDLQLPDSKEAKPKLRTLREVRAQAEREAVTQALAQTRGNISAAAKLLAVSRPTFYDLLKRFEMNP